MPDEPMMPGRGRPADLPNRLEPTLLRTLADRVAAVGPEVIGRLKSEASADLMDMHVLAQRILDIVAPGRTWLQTPWREDGTIRCPCRKGVFSDGPPLSNSHTLKWSEAWGYARERDRALRVAECPVCGGVCWSATR